MARRSSDRNARLLRKTGANTLLMGLSVLVWGALAGSMALAGSVVLGLAAGVAYFYLLGWQVAAFGKSGIMNAVKVLMAKGRFLILIGAAIAAANLPPLSMPGTLVGVVATQVAFLLAIRQTR